MGKLPFMQYRDKIRKSVQVRFGGYNHTAGAKDGQIYDMQNMTSDDLPLLSVRGKRYKARTLTKPNGIFAYDGLYWVDGTAVYKDGTAIGTVQNGKKQFACVGNYIVIFPDKMYYNTQGGEFRSMESSWTGLAQVKDGTFAGVVAKSNTIYSAGANWQSRFKVGDGLTISGSGNAKNNKTAIVKEIDGDNLRFYENAFANTSGNETLTIKRSVPDMDFVFEHENRLWGGKDDTVYASKPGDPLNFNVFDGVSTDSYAANVGSKGMFTGGCRFLGHACFFKDDTVYKVYGSKPSNFQVVGSASLGVESGSGGSLAIASERLFYLSRTGIVLYSGGIPADIARVFGKVNYKNAVGGSDGKKYYVSMQDESGGYHLFVYDVEANTWHKEDHSEAIGFAYHDGLYMLMANGDLWVTGREPKPGESPEPDIISMVEFADFEENNPNRKGVSKIQIRLEMEEGSSLKASIMFDSSGSWNEVKTVTADRKKSFYLPIIPQRCDHFKIKLEGVGAWKIHSMAREIYSGSEL